MGPFDNSLLINPNSNFALYAIIKAAIIHKQQFKLLKKFSIKERFRCFNKSNICSVVKFS